MTVRFSRRLPAVVLTFALGAGQAGVCAGWMPTAEARMACCTEDGPCLMHESDSQDGPTRVVTQAEADRCCALSEQDDPSPSPTSPAFFTTLAVALSPVPQLLPEPEPHAGIARAAARIPAAHVPKHVLLSVFRV
jgi:hypothetical protein